MVVQVRFERKNVYTEYFPLVGSKKLLCPVCAVRVHNLNYDISSDCEVVSLHVGVWMWALFDM